MARRFRSRRFRPRSARRIKFRKSSLRRIKRDIQKCNFPTKVKFMGLTEKKVMFLTYQKDMSFTPGENGVSNHSMYLVPTSAENYDSIVTLVDEESKKPNWDKMCVLGIYIKIQPNANTFDGSEATKKIYPVQCFYAMDSCPVDDVINYDKGLRTYKQLFTFNSNEAFTIYVPAPTTMDFVTSVVHRSKTWWSLATLKNLEPAEYIKMDVERDDMEQRGNYRGDEDDENLIGVVPDPSITTGEGQVFHCGRLAFYCKGNANFNITVNFKVALKG